MTTFPEHVIMSVGSLPITNGDIEQLVTTGETPGGFATCSFSMCGNGRSGIDWGDYVVIYDNQYAKYPFIGRVSSLHKRGLTYDIQATRSTRDRTFTVNTVPADANHPSGLTSQRIYPAGTPLVNILRDALLVTPDIFDGGINELSGLQLTTNSNDLGQWTAEQVWDYVSSIIGSISTPLLWHIRGFGNLQVVVIDYQDIAPRYFTTVPEEQIEETYDMQAIVNEVSVSFGNGQIAVSPVTGDPYDYSVIPIIRTKALNAQNTVASYADALAIADGTRQRLSTRRSVNDVITLDCNKDTVRAVHPVTDPLVAVDAWPLWLIESGHGIQLNNRPIVDASYNLRDKYITGVEYNWDDGKLTLRCGEIRSQQSETTKIIDYNVNRLFNGPYNGPPGGNHPLADADLLPKIGPEIDTPISTSYGVPAFKAQADGEDSLPHKKAIDPNIIADEGLAANIIFDPSTAGFQAAIQVTPGTFSQYRLLLGDDTGLINDTVVAQLYKVIKPSAGGGTLFLTEIKSNGLKDTDQVPIAPSIILTRNDYYMIKVTTVGATATWAALSLHAKKNYPGLKP